MEKLKNHSKPPTELTESRLLVSYAFDLARKLNITRLLVLADLLQDRHTVEKHRKQESIIWVLSGGAEAPSTAKRKGDSYIEIPAMLLGRMDQVKLGLLMSVLRNEIGVNDSVVCLTGAAGSKRLDNLLIANPRRDFLWFANRKMQRTSGLLISNEFVRLLEIAVKFATEGREGKSIGTTFVLGDPKSLKKYTRPLIMNPCQGHLRKFRQIHNPNFLESLRELAGLDGAFIVDRRGVVDSAGVYLDAPLTRKMNVPRGLGARHTAAAALSAKTQAIAITISESSGTVTVYSQGEPVLEIGRAR